MRRSVEHELKLVPGDSFRLADLGEPLAPRVFQSTYHDTPDFRLARHGITLRLRMEDGAGLWQLKLPTGGDARVELEAPGTPAAPPEEMTDILVVHLREHQLRKVVRLRTRRQTVRRDGAEIVEDAVSVFDGPRVVKRFRELEVELVDGDVRVLRRLERELERRGASRGGLTPKLFRALDLEFDDLPKLETPLTPVETLGHALLEQQRGLVVHDPGTRLGSDPEHLHQMRVATRRARAFLRAGAPLVEPDWRDGLRAELGWLGSALGPARDADVLLEYVTDATDAVGEDAGDVLRALEKERLRARRAAVAALSRKRYFVLLDRLAESPPAVEADGVRLADLWWKEFKRTRKAFAALGKRSADGELHAARIRVKRARYAAELAAPELGEAGDRFVTAAKKLQDVLGEHQDSTVATDWVARWGESNPERAQVVKPLLERERERRKSARRAWPGEWERLLRRARQAKP